jgi:hypothetical protein
VKAKGRLTGHEMIADERLRQVTDEKYDYQHDDLHPNRELARAAYAYISFVLNPDRMEDIAGVIWPWDGRSFKPTADNPIRNLTKAGALIAAEIDRLLRLSWKS